MYIHWNLWLRKKVILKQFQTYPLSIVYEFRSLMETRIYLLSRSFPRFTYENLGNSLKKCPSTRSKHFEFFLLVSVDRKAIYRDQGNWYLRRGKRKENYTANFYTGRSTRRRSGRPITRFCNFLPYRMAELAWSTKAFKIHSSRRIRNFIDPGNKRLCQPACVAYHGKENALRPSRLSRFTRLKHARNPTVHFIRVYTSTMFA